MQTEKEQLAYDISVRPPRCNSLAQIQTCKANFMQLLIPDIIQKHNEPYYGLSEELS